jgi:phage baseplate assembly protein W
MSIQNENSFLGKGWSFPPKFNNEKGTVEMVSDEVDIKESIEIILSTNHFERVMQLDFGSGLNQFLFEEITENLTNKIENEIFNSLLIFEPRIEVNDILIEEDEEEPGLLLIHINYSIRETNSRYNMVYPFYLNEAQ